jgi:hypothetical protein
MTAYEITRMWTLTYALPVVDVAVVDGDMAAFLKRLWRKTGTQPYVWVIERHANGALHVHFATSSYIPVCVMSAAWRHGRVASPAVNLDEGLERGAIEAARALAKYMLKNPVPGSGGRFFRRGRGPIEVIQTYCEDLDEAAAVSSEVFGREPQWQAVGGLTWAGRFSHPAPGWFDHDGPSA